MLYTTGKRGKELRSLGGAMRVELLWTNSWQGVTKSTAKAQEQHILGHTEGDCSAAVVQCFWCCYEAVRTILVQSGT